MRRALTVLLIVALAGGGIGVCVVNLLGTKDELKPLAEAAMRAIADGRFQELDAAPAFWDDADVPRLEILRRDLRLALGEYEGLGEASGVSRGTNLNGDYASVTVDVRFSRGTTRGEFIFGDVGDQWKLSGFDLELPDPDPPDMAALEGLARSHLALFLQDDTAALVNAFALELQREWNDSLASSLAAMRQRLGAFNDATLEGVAPDGNTQRVTLLANFAGGTMRWVLTYKWHFSEWMLLGYDAADVPSPPIVPVPPVPVTPPVVAPNPG